MSNNSVPKLFALLLMAAIIPQWIDNDIISTVLKILIILLFYILIRYVSITIRLSSFTMVYFPLYVINVLIAYFIYGGGLFPIIQSLVISFVTLRLFYDIPQSIGVITEDDVLRFYKVYSYFILLSCVYNMIVNYSSVFAISTWRIYRGIEIKSFFDNKNTFGVFLMFGVLASSILQVREGSKRWRFIILVLLYNELMAMCRTAIIISLIILIASYFADRKSRVKRIAFISLLSLAVVYVLMSSGFFHNLVFDTLFGNLDSVDSRNALISALLPHLRGSVLFTGVGSQRAGEMAHYYTGNQYIHNTYLAALVTGGIPRLSLLIAAVVVSFIYSRRIAMIDKSCSSICLMSLIAYLVYGFSESVILFESPVVSMTSTIFVISMPMLWFTTIKAKA